MNCTIREIYPGLYSILDDLNVFCYLATGDNKALLFDTGHGSLNLPEIVKVITSKPVTVVLGHGHPDHACGAYQFEEVFIHKADFDVCRENTSLYHRQVILDSMKRVGSEFPQSLDVDEFKNAGSGNMKEIEPGAEIDLGGLTAEIIGMPGHTPGSIGILLKEAKILLTGDAANDHFWLFWPEAMTIQEQIATLERTLQLNFDSFFVGHSDGKKPKSDIHKYISVARNATLEKATPYDQFTQHKPYIYREDGVEIVFNERTLNKG